MNIGLCEYCLETLTVQRCNLALGCGHAICNYCVQFIKSNYNLNYCPFDKTAYNKPIEELPFHKATRVIVKPKSDNCEKHGIPNIGYSKNKNTKVCGNCVDEQRLDKIDIVEKNSFYEYFSSKNLEIKEEFLVLNSEYERISLLFDRLNRLPMRHNYFKKIKEEITSEVCEKDLDYKMSLLKNCDFFSFSRIFLETTKDFNAFCSSDFSKLAIKKEKIIISLENKLCIWTGNILKLFQSEGLMTNYVYRYRIESQKAFRLTSIGLGIGFLDSSQVFYVRIIIETKNQVLDITEQCINYENTLGISLEFLINQSLIIQPAEKFKVCLITNNTKIFAILPEDEVLSGDWKLIRIKNSHQPSPVLYFKLEAI